MLSVRRVLQQDRYTVDNVCNGVVDRLKLLVSRSEHNGER
jgi:hypothetical protein